MDDIHLEKPDLVKKALKLEWFLITYNVIEAIASVSFGFLAGSIALIGFGLDSVIESTAAGILIWRLSVHTNSEDERQRERNALVFVGITFFLLALYIFYESGSKLIHGETPEASIAGIIIAVLSLIIMPFLGRRKRKLARALESRALEADATETILCAYLSAALLSGLLLNAFFGWWWADPLTALIIGGFAIKEGWEVIEKVRN